MSQTTSNQHSKQERNAPFRVKSAVVSLISVLAIGAYFVSNLLALLPSDELVPDGVLSITIVTIMLIVIVEVILQAVLFIGAGRIEEQSKQDEVVAAKASRNAYHVLTIGVFTTFTSMFADFTPFEMGILLMITFLIAEMVKFASQIVFYRQIM